MAALDPASDEAQNEAEDTLDAIGIAIGVSSLVIIAKAIKRLTKNTTISDAMASSSKDLEALEKIMKRGAAKYDEATKELYAKLAERNDAWAKMFYEYAGVEQVPALEHPKVSNMIESSENAALQGVKATCNTSVVGLIDRNGQFVPYAEEYRRIMNRAITSMAIGETSYTTEIQRTFKELSRSGLRVQYASGVTRELYGAMRTNIMDGYRDTMVDIREVQGLEYGARDIEVSAHTMCAPDHLPYQGKQFTQEEFRNLQEGELRKRPIEAGANCRHRAYRVIKGLTSPANSEERLELYRRQSEGIVSFTGMGGDTLEMSGYEATQYQRRVEHRIRTLKTEGDMLDAAGFQAFGKLAKGDARSYTRYYKTMSEEAGLTTRIERTKVRMI